MRMVRHYHSKIHQFYNMKKAKIVVGLGYGDEGKGIVTDYLCQESSKPIVVRYGGGPQCGHTVIRGDKKHVFANFGSGTLQGVPTYFSEHTAINPVNIEIEAREIFKLTGIMPRLYVHPMAVVITPFDIIADIKCTGNYNNGTCQMGVGKAKHRTLTSPVKLYARDLTCPKIVERKLHAIRLHYMIGTLNNEIDKFLGWLIKPSFKIGDYRMLNYYDTLVFEGNQGVLLDMNHGVFPDVTYSNTTSKNAIEICNKIGVKDVEIYHITRAYHTRHGRGEFSEEPIELINTEEETCTFNSAQGSFKTAKMDYELLNAARDVDEIYSGMYPHKLVVTCNDQIKDHKDAFNKHALTKPYLDIWYTYSPDTTKINIK